MKHYLFRCRPGGYWFVGPFESLDAALAYGRSVEDPTAGSRWQVIETSARSLDAPPLVVSPTEGTPERARVQRALGDLAVARRHLDRLVEGRLVPSALTLSEVRASIDRCVDRLSDPLPEEQSDD